MNLSLVTTMLYNYINFISNVPFKGMYVRFQWLAV